MKNSIVRNVSVALFATVCAGLLSTSASAQTTPWPSRPIKMVIPFGAGGGTDVIGRFLAQKFSEGLGQTVVVETRPGAGGSLGSAEVARAPADGYTILLGSSSTHGINPGMYAKLPYDPLKDFEPIGLIATNLFVMSVPKDSPVKTVADLVRLSQEAPGQYDYASSGNGTTSHLAAALFVSMSGAKLTHIPYKSNVPGLTDLMAGRVAMMFDNITAMQRQISAGSIRPLATTGLKRNAVLKDVPTLDEAGVKGYDLRGWFCLLAPAGTPVAIVTRLNHELVRVIALPEVTEKLISLGADPETSTPQELKALIAAEIIKYKKIIDLAGAKLE
ncbi:MAG: tripartite tricarboxylate transporter substrate binding protein [Alcaligenaceae bacterium]